MIGRFCSRRQRQCAVPGLLLSRRPDPVKQSNDRSRDETLRCCSSSGTSWTTWLLAESRKLRERLRGEIERRRLIAADDYSGRVGRGRPCENRRWPSVDFRPQSSQRYTFSSGSSQAGGSPE